MRFLRNALFAYLTFRHRVRMRLIRSEREKARKRHRAFLVSRNEALRLDERSTIDRFKRENGLR